MRNFLYVPTLMLIASILGPMSTAILAPALPVIECHFNSTNHSIQQIMNFNLASIAISGVLYGALSESFGRRPIFLLGILLFSTGALLSYSAGNLGGLIFFQIIQSCGMGVGTLISAVVSDIYQDKKSVKLISIFGIFVPLAIHSSSFIGGYITQYLGWTFIFLIQFIIGIGFFAFLYFGFPETISLYHSHSFKEKVKAYENILKNIQFLRLMLVICLPFTGLWMYHLTAPFVFIQQFKLTPSEYGLYPIISISGLVLGNIFVNYKIHILDNILLLKIGVFIAICGSLIFLFLTISSYHTPLGFAICMAIYYFGCAPLFSIALVQAVNNTENSKGYAAALIRGGQFMMASITGVIFSLFYQTSFLFTGVLILVCTIVVNFLIWNLDTLKQDL